MNSIKLSKVLGQQDNLPVPDYCRGFFVSPVLTSMNDHLRELSLLFNNYYA